MTTRQSAIDLVKKKFSVKESILQAPLPEEYYHKDLFNSLLEGAFTDSLSNKKDTKNPKDQINQSTKKKKCVDSWTSGPLLSKAGDLAAILSNLQKNDILFIDEIHRLTSAIEEVLYPAMEDYCLDLIVGEGPAANDILLVDTPKIKIEDVKKVQSFMSTTAAVADQVYTNFSRFSLIFSLLSQNRFAFDQLQQQK